MVIRGMVYDIAIPTLNGKVTTLEPKLLDAERHLSRATKALGHAQSP